MKLNFLILGILLSLILILPERTYAAPVIETWSPGWNERWTQIGDDCWTSMYSNGIYAIKGVCNSSRLVSGEYNFQKPLTIEVSLRGQPVSGRKYQAMAGFANEKESCNYLHLGVSNVAQPDAIVLDVNCREVILGFIQPWIWTKVKLVYIPASSIVEIWANNVLVTIKEWSPNGNIQAQAICFAPDLASSECEFGSYIIDSPL